MEMISGDSEEGKLLQKAFGGMVGVLRYVPKKSPDARKFDALTYDEAICAPHLSQITGSSASFPSTLSELSLGHL